MESRNNRIVLPPSRSFFFFWASYPVHVQRQSWNDYIMFSQVTAFPACADEPISVPTLRSPSGSIVLPSKSIPLSACASLPSPRRPSCPPQRPTLVKTPLPAPKAPTSTSLSLRVQSVTPPVFAPSQHTPKPMFPHRSPPSLRTPQARLVTISSILALRLHAIPS